MRAGRMPLARSAATAARWPIGVALTSWRYLWRTTPIHRSEEAGCWPDDGPRRCRASSSTSRCSAWATGPDPSSTAGTLP